MRPVRLLALLLLAAPASAEWREREATPPAAPPHRELPVPFEPNVGQADPAVRFLARGRGFLLLLTDGGALFVRRDGPALRMRLEGAPGRLVAGPRLPGVSNYFLGNDPSKWRREVPHYRSVQDRSAAMDLRWRGDRGGVEYEAVLAAGAARRTLAFTMEGAESIDVDAGGDLLVRARDGVLRQSRPVAFQEGPEGRIPVPARFVARDARRFRIEAGPCDPSLPLVVDPRVEFATYVGGTGPDYGTAGAVDAAGSAYVAGYTGSTNYPVQGAFQGAKAGNYDAFVTKFDPSGASLVYSTYLGGSGGNQTDSNPFGLAVDSTGAAYVVGRTQSTTFPTLGAIQAGSNGGMEAFVTKLGSSGSQLAYSTYIGGNSDDWAGAVAVDASGAAYVAGTTASASFPGLGNFGGSRGGLNDAWVAKFSAAGSSLAYGFYFGGSSAEYVNGIALDSTGAAYLAGQTYSANFPVLGAFQSSLGGIYDGFVAKLNSSGSALVYASYLGGSGQDAANSVAVDASGVATVVGTAGGTGLPTQNPLYGTFGGGGTDAFISRVSANGASLLFSTYLGGSGAESGYGVTLDSAGSAYVVGSTGSTATFPLAGAFQGTYGGGATDAFLLKLNPAATAIAYSTYLGGSGDDEGRGVAVRGTDAFVTGLTTSTNFPVLGPYQGSTGGSNDTFVVKAITTPKSPTGISSSLIAVDGIEAIWNDNSTDETGFELERKIGAGAFLPRATIPAGTTVYDDAGLSSGTKYTYRVRAVNADGVSGWSNETTTTTPPAFPGVPLSPSGLEAAVISSTRVDLTWTDESSDETFFQVQRKTGTGTWQVLATPGPGATSYSDLTTLPDRSYAYRVRAANGTGFSDYSVEAAVATPASVGFVLEKGLLKDSARTARDTVKLRGTFTLGGDSPDGTYDPPADGFEVRLGGREGTVLVGLPGGTEGWVLRRGVWTWRSPKGSSPRATIGVDPVNGTWSLVLVKATLPALPANPIVLSVAFGNDAGTEGEDWTDPPRKPGVLKFP